MANICSVRRHTNISSKWCICTRPADASWRLCKDNSSEWMSTICWILEVFRSKSFWAWLGDTQMHTRSSAGLETKIKFRSFSFPFSKHEINRKFKKLGANLKKHINFCACSSVSQKCYVTQESLTKSDVILKQPNCY